jgi:hypothetical protein
MSNIENGWVWSKNCIDQVHEEDCQGCYDRKAPMLLDQDPN